MATEFVISLQYIDPKFYEKENKTGFLADCRPSRRLDQPGSQTEEINRVGNILEASSSKICEHMNFDPIFQMASYHFFKISSF